MHSLTWLWLIAILIIAWVYYRWRRSQSRDRYRSTPVEPSVIVVFKALGPVTGIRYVTRKIIQWATGGSSRLFSRGIAWLIIIGIAAPIFSPDWEGCATSIIIFIIVVFLILV
jgi:hypothetical protein